MADNATLLAYLDEARRVGPGGYYFSAYIEGAIDHLAHINETLRALTMLAKCEWCEPELANEFINHVKRDIGVPVDDDSA